MQIGFMLLLSPPTPHLSDAERPLHLPFDTFSCGKEKMQSVSSSPLFASPSVAFEPSPLREKTKEKMVMRIWEPPRSSHSAADYQSIGGSSSTRGEHAMRFLLPRQLFSFSVVEEGFLLLSC